MTKQRIVGSIVLIALALIFLPIIFDGEGSYEPEISSRIPDAPLIEPLTLPQPIRPVVLAEQPDFVESPETILDEAAVTPAQNPVAIATEQAPEEAVEQLAPAADVVVSEPSFVRQAPSLGGDGLPEGWSVRLGAFSDEDNANALHERLQASGYKAYVKRLQREDRQLTAVYVGPWLERGVAQNYQKELQESFQLAGMIERYTIDPL